MPVDLPSHVNNVQELELTIVLNGVNQNSLWAIKTALDKAATEKQVAGLQSVSHSLFILAAASSMMLDTELPNSPFKPFGRSGDRRTPALEDFGNDDQKFFESVVNDIELPVLQARVADILWLVKTKDRFKFAQIAVKAYFQTPLNQEAWNHNRLENWSRGLQLARQLGNGLKSEIEKATESLESEFEKTNLESAYYGIAIARVIAQYSLSWSDDDLAREQFKQFAASARDSGNFELALDLFTEALTELSVAAMDAEVVKLRIEVASCLESIAEKSHGLVSGVKYEKAIEVLRQIPVSLRSEHDVDARIEELRGKFAETGNVTLEHMTLHQSPPIDLSDLQQSARRLVQADTVIGSLKLLANVHEPPQKVDIFEESRKQLIQFPLKGMFQGIHFTKDGRKAAIVPSTDGMPHEHPETVWETAVTNLQHTVKILVHGVIGPALHAIKWSHRVRYQDFVEIVKDAPNLPADRRLLWARALYLGYEGDFVSALHVGVPQIEHLVRVFLKRNGCTTTTLGEGGIETEIGLSALLEREKAKSVFGEDLLFEMKGLLTDQIGPNLRNELAHGLASVNDCLSFNAVYVWWLMLRIACASPSAQDRNNDLPRQDSAEAQKSE